MKQFLFTMICLLSLAMADAQDAPQKFERAEYYAVMASGDLERINTELGIVQSSTVTDKEGYEGALLMRRAGLLAQPREKLRNFKQGRIKLETALLADSSKTELRFLRLSIEEHAPNIVKYRSDLNRDRLFVEQHFKGLSPVVQKAIIDYSKSSRILKAGDL